VAARKRPEVIVHKKWWSALIDRSHEKCQYARGDKSSESNTERSLEVAAQESP
jgi:hypothetical protein